MEYHQRLLIDGDGVSSFPLLRHVKLSGTNFEIGQQLAEINILNHGDQLEQHRAPDPVYARARRDYLRRQYPILGERMRGVAVAFETDVDDDRYDFSALFYNIDVPLRPSCSNAYYPPHRTSDGHAYLSRNYEFSTGTIADVFRLPLSAEARAQMKAMMGEPYIMEWQPTDGGYASWTVQSNDLLGGVFDGINSAGLAVALMADEEAMAHIYEPQSRFIRAVGVNELQVMRLLLDTCATTDQAKQLLLTVKQYYHWVPCHYMIADSSGQSFIYETSSGRNHALILDGGGQPQVCTNHQVYRHSQGDFPELSLQTNSQWRYATLQRRVTAQDDYSPADIRANSRAVGIGQLFHEMQRDPGFRSIAANVNSRTLWYTLYDLTERRVEIDFYLNSRVNEAGSYEEERSDVFRFHVPPMQEAIREPAWRVHMP